MPKSRRVLLSLFIPVILLAVTACPGLIIDYISVSFDGGFAVVGATGTFTCISPVTGEVITYEWSFGDGGSAIGKTATHTYIAPGEYLVTCRILTGTGAITYTKKLEIAGLPLDLFIDGAVNTSYDCTVGLPFAGLFQSGITGLAGTTRQIGADNAGGTGTTDVIIDTSANTFSVTSSCTNENGTGISYLDEGGPGAETVDLSQFTQIRIPILSISGTIELGISMTDVNSAGASSVILVSSTGDLVVPFTDFVGVDFSINIKGIAFAVLVGPGESITLGQMTFE